MPTFSGLRLAPTARPAQRRGVERANAVAANFEKTSTKLAQSTLETTTQQVRTQLGQIGARARRVETMQGQNQADAVTMNKNLSNIEDVDLTQVMMQLQTQQVAYPAAVGATASAPQPSLAGFLR